MFNLIKPGSNYDFVGKKSFFLGLSSLAILATIYLFFTKGLTYGVDFTGGAEVQVRVPVSFDIGQLRTALDGAGLSGVKVQQIQQATATSNSDKAEFVIRAQGDESTLTKVSDLVESAIKGKVGAGQYEILKTDMVGPAAGSLLRKKGFLSMFYALLVILVYVAIRFNTRYAPGAVLALFHDTVITIGILIVAGKQFDLTVLAAILALIGYSNNDTIIIYDRVREEINMHPNMKIEEAVNLAVNDTLGRTIMTSLCTFIVVAALYFKGGAVIHDFAFTLLVGIVVGSYSSVFIASSLVILITNYFDQKGRQYHKSSKKKKEYQVRANPSSHAS
jgi:preprotein translocase subunit SecF